MQDVLIKFLVTLSILFFIPKILYRLYKIPFPITEVLLGIGFGLALPQFFQLDEVLQVLAALGIISLFVHSGMEVDLHFISKNKRFFAENLLRSLLVSALVVVLLYSYFKTSLLVSIIAALGFTTPSAGYIFSILKSEDKELKNWIGGKAIAGELLALFLLIILLKISQPKALALSLVVVLILITLLPIALRYLYQRIFSKVLGAEFSFIFVVAVVTASITELLGIHFLVGAFIAGVVSREFVHHLVKAKEYSHVTMETGQQIIEGFSFFAIIFAPFYFFSVGVQVSSQVFPLTSFIVTLTIAAIAIAIRIGSIYFHRVSRIRETTKKSILISTAILPTLVFSFVIAEILNSEFQVTPLLYTSLTIYGLLSTLISFLAQKFIHHSRLR